MTWADRDIETAEKQQYFFRDRARESHPEFVEFADKVLRNLEYGIKKVAWFDWSITMTPGLWISARCSFHQNEPVKTFIVNVDYPNLTFVVDSRSHATWPNNTRTVSPSIIGPPISHDQVDLVAEEIIGNFLPHFKSPTFVLEGGLSKAQEAELDKGRKLNEGPHQTRYDPRTGAAQGVPVKVQQGGILSKLFRGK